MVYSARGTKLETVVKQNEAELKETIGEDSPGISFVLLTPFEITYNRCIPATMCIREMHSRVTF